MLAGLYKKTGFIISAMVGLYLLTTVVLDRLQIINYYADIPYFEFFCGLIILLGPVLITCIAVRQFNSNPDFQQNIQYTFSDNGVAIQGNTFKGEFLWAHVTKQKEISNFLILYHTKKMGNLIDKTKLTKEQLQFIKTKVETKQAG